MLLKKIIWYLIMLIKYFIFCGIITALVSAIFPPAGVILGILLILGSFAAAHDDLKEKIIPKLEYKNLKKKYEKVSFEFKAFDEMLSTVKKTL